MENKSTGYLKLKAYFVEHGIKQTDVAKLLNLSRSAFNTKLNQNGADFSLNEVRLLCKTYKISPSEFFLI